MLLTRDDISGVTRCLERSGLGHLVHELICVVPVAETGQRNRADQYDYDISVYAGLGDLCLIHLTQITSLLSQGFISCWLGSDIEGHFPNVQEVHLDIYDPDVFNGILRLKHLKECVLYVAPGIGEVKNVTVMKQNGVRQLSLNKLEIVGDLFQPSVVNFLQQVESVEVRLITSDSTVTAALNALNTTMTSLRIFGNDSSSALPELLDDQLRRFKELRSLALTGTGIRLSG
jgi:hypothetical protein